MRPPIYIERLEKLMPNKKVAKDRISNILEVPKEVGIDLPKITIIGFDEMLIENYKGVLEYEEFYIRISTNIGIVNINGFNLELEQITKEDVLIKGTIEDIDIEELE